MSQIKELLEQFNKLSITPKINEGYEPDSYKFYNKRMTPEQFCSYVNFKDKKKELAYFKTARNPIFSKLLSLVANEFTKINGTRWGKSNDDQKVLVLEYTGEGNPVKGSTTEFPGKNWYLFEDTSKPGNRVYVNLSNLKASLDRSTNVWMFSGTVELMVVREFEQEDTVKPRVYKAYTNPTVIDLAKSENEGALQPPNKGANISSAKVKKIVQEFDSLVKEQTLAKLGFDSKEYEFTSMSATMGSKWRIVKKSDPSKVYVLEPSMSYYFDEINSCILGLDRNIDKLYSIKTD